MHSNGNFGSGAPKGSAPPARAPSSLSDRCCHGTARVLEHATGGGVVLMGLIGTGGLTRPALGCWTIMIVSTMALWMAWLCWRIVRGDRAVPAHVLQCFLGGTVLICLGHLVAASRADAVTGRIEMFVGSDSSVMIRLMTLCLLLLLVQDVLSRVRDPRWLLTGVGLAASVGAILRLNSGVAVPGAPAVALSGLAGVGMIVTCCLLPDWPGSHSLLHHHGRYKSAWAGGRAIAAALLSGLLIVSHPGAAVAAAVAMGAAAGAMGLSAVFLRRHRGALFGGGVMLAAGAVGSAMRLPMSLPRWIHEVSWLGTGLAPEMPAHADAAGAWILASSAGWVGLGVVVAGMVLAMALSLYAVRNAAPGDQARSAVWAVVSALAGCALLVGGGLTVPGVTVTAAIAWGLMPNLMAHRVRRYHGWPVMLAFAAGLLVLGLDQRLAGSPWVTPALIGRDGLLHFAGAFGLTIVVCWQVRSWRWWHAVLVAVACGALAAGGEVAQKYLSRRTPDWSDVWCDLFGAAVAAGAFCVLRIIAWIEGLYATRPKVSYAKYRSVPAR